MTDEADDTYGQVVFQNEDVNDSRRKDALARAWTTRNFEIELYWKRALYFWGFIALAIAGYVKGHDTEYSLILAGIGLIFSIAWFLVNKASKFWQENWEAHIDCLEDELEGRLYKTVMKNKISFWNSFASYPFSVSKINQGLSFFIVLIWVGLVVKELSILDFPNLLAKPYAPYGMAGGLIILLGVGLWFVRTSFMRENDEPFNEIDKCIYEYHNRDIENKN